MKKIMMILVGIAFIATVVITVSAQSETFTDPVGDVNYIYSGADGMPVGYNVDNKPDIDIIEVKYEVSDDTLTVSMKVSGEIIQSETVMYKITLNTGVGQEEERGGMYIVTLMDGDDVGSIAMGPIGSNTPTVAVQGDNTIIATFNLVCSFPEPVNILGQTVELGDYSIGEQWSDAAPVGSDDDPTDLGENGGTTPPPGENGGTTTPSGNGTPGFELIAVLAALGAAFILIKKRK